MGLNALRCRADIIIRNNSSSSSSNSSSSSSGSSSLAICESESYVRAITVSYARADCRSEL